MFSQSLTLLYPCETHVTPFGDVKFWKNPKICIFEEYAKTSKNQKSVYSGFYAVYRLVQRGFVISDIKLCPT